MEIILFMLGFISALIIGGLALYMNNPVGLITITIILAGIPIIIGFIFSYDVKILVISVMIGIFISHIPMIIETLKQSYGDNDDKLDPH